MIFTTKRDRLRLKLLYFIPRLSKNNPSSIKYLSSSNKYNKNFINCLLKYTLLKKINYCNDLINEG